MSNKFVKLGSDETWSGLKGLAEIHFIRDPNYSSGTSHIFRWEEATSMGAFEQTPHEASVGRHNSLAPWGGQTG